MTTKAKAKSKNRFTDYLTPTFLVCCQDVILGTDNTVTLIRLLEGFMSFTIPTDPVFKLFVAAELRRNEEKDLKEFGEANLSYYVKLVSPDGTEHLMGSFAPPLFGQPQPWVTTRIALDLCYKVLFKTTGMYRFRLVGKIGDSEEEVLLDSPFPVKQIPDIPGSYKAIFSSDESTGEGNLTLENGRMTGGDSGSVWAGIYVLNGSTITGHAQIQINEAGKSILGDAGSFMLQLSGIVKNEEIEITGFPQGRPGVNIAIKLIRSKPPEQAKSARAKKK